MQHMGLNPPLKSTLNEEFQTRTITVTQSIFCCSMILYSILRSNCVYNPPANKHNIELVGSVKNLELYLVYKCITQKC